MGSLRVEILADVMSEANLQKVVDLILDPPQIRIYCGDDHLRVGPAGLRFDTETGVIAGPSPTCSESPITRGYVLRSQGRPYMIILCPTGLAFLNTIGPARYVDQTGVWLDNAVGVSGTLLHEFLHITSLQSNNPLRHQR